MRRTLGPILTTGVALTAAGVVVANPIVAPRSDIQIPSVALSAGTGDAISMLDQAFLDAIAPAPPESTNPFSVLRQLVSSLAADASYMGKNAIVDAFVAGVTAVSEPELTAASTPYFTPPSPELAMSILPGLDLTSITPVSDAVQALPALASAVTDTVSPAVKSFVGNLIHDAGYVGGELIAAAFATGALVANEPRLIGETLKALVKGDFSGALENAVKAVTAPFGPPIIIVNAVATLIEKYVGDLSAALLLPLPLPQAPTPAPDSAGTTPDVEPTPVAVPETGEQARAPRGAVPVLPLDNATDVPQPAAALTAADSRLEATEIPATDTQAAEAAEATDDTTVAPRAAARSVRDAIAAAGEQIGSAASAAADAVGKASARARGGKPGPAGN